MRRPTTRRQASNGKHRRSERIAQRACNCPLRNSLRVSAEHLVQFAAGITVAQLSERPLLGDLARRAHEAAPRRPRQRTADTDAADTDTATPRAPPRPRTKPPLR